MLLPTTPLTVRLFLKNKLFVLINTISLTVAVAFAIIAFWVYRYNYEFNTFFKDGQSIFRLHTKGKQNDSPTIDAASYTAFWQKAQSQVFVTRYQLSSNFVSTQRTYKNCIVATVDAEFFDIFDFRFLHPPLSSQMRPNWIIITKSLAQRFFGDNNPTGETIQVETEAGMQAFMVAAVLDDLPTNTSLWFDALVLFTAYDFHNFPEPDAYDAVFYTSKTDSLAKLSLPEQLYPVSLTELHHLEDQFVETKFNGVFEGQLTRIILVSMLLLLLASFNFTNTALLSTFHRLPELGLRRILGASRIDLFRLLLFENIAIVMLSMLAGLALSYVFVDIYNQWWDTMPIQANYNDIDLYLYLCFLFVLIGLGSCIFPALYAGGLSPAEALLQRRISHLHKWVARALVLGQFSVLALLSFHFTVFWQNDRYQQHFDWGYQHENILNIRTFSLKDYLGMTSALKREFPRIKFSGSHHLVGFHQHTEEYVLEGIKEKVGTLRVSFNYPQLLQLRLVAGRWPNINHAELVVNQRFIDQYGPTSEVVSDGRSHRVVGVVGNFAMQGHQPDSPKPLVIRLIGSDAYRYLSIRYTDESREDIEKVLRFFWTKHLDGHVFEAFAQDRIFDLEKKLNRVMLRLYSFLLGLATLVGMLGIYTYVRVAVERRRTELGVRKTFGAMGRQVVQLIYREFLPLVLLAATVGLALGYYSVRLFLLMVFRMHTELNLFSFLWPSAFLLLVLVLSVSSRVVSTAVQLPIRFLGK